MELLQQFKDEDRDVDRIVALITHDPALAAQVLKLCNSAAFAADHPVDDMFEAISRVGFYEIYRLVAAVLGARAVSMGGKTKTVDLAQFWRHSVLVAVAAETIAARYDDGGGVAFTAGLLHDIGKVVLAAVEENAYAEVIAGAGMSGIPLMAAEATRFGVHHAAIGGRLLARWRLPANLASAVENHHDPAKAKGAERLAAYTNIANELAHVIRLGRTPPTVTSRETLEAMTVLPLYQAEIPALVVLINDKLEEAASILSVAG
jgi:putative nucleotidyltransferase with HDIG domain